MRASLLQEANLPLPLPESAIQQLYQDLRYGSTKELRDSAAKAFIEHHLRLGMSMAMAFGRKHGKIDEFVAVMAFSLTNAVALMQKGAIDHHKTPNPVGYIIKYVRGRLRMFKHKDRILSVRIETAKRRGTLGVSSLSNKEFADSSNQSLAIKHGSLIEIKEILTRLVLTKQEKRVIGRRMLGEADLEIGERMNLTKQRVYQIRMGVGKRLKEELAK